MTLLQKLKSNPFALWLCIFSVVMLAPNVFYVFHRVAGDMPIPYLREVQAVGWALLISGYILYYTLHKNLNMAERYAWFEFGISTCYYIIRLLIKDGAFVWDWYILPALAFAYMLPWSVKELAKSIKDEVIAPLPPAKEINITIDKLVPDMLNIQTGADIKTQVQDILLKIVNDTNLINEAAIQSKTAEILPPPPADELEAAFKEGAVKKSITQPIVETKNNQRF